MTTIGFLGMFAALVFCVGALLGASLQDRVHEQERRRWLARNRTLQVQVERFEALAGYVAASEDDN